MKKIPTKYLLVFNAKAVVLAAGGANRLYPCLCNGIEAPIFQTNGDSFYLAFDAGIPLLDMEFTQFRDSPPLGSIYGGKYLNALGERFMEKYDPQALEKAPRYLVTAAVYIEIMEGRGPVTCNTEGLLESEPGVPVGHEIGNKKLVEITLQFQRVLGGARINEKAETSLMGLFAAGESAGGVQGGDRMQGNAFIETQAFGANAGRNAAILAQNIERAVIKPVQIKEEQARLASIKGDANPAELNQTVNKIMWEQVGLGRDKHNLQDALAKFEGAGDVIGLVDAIADSCRRCVGQSR